MTSNIRRLTAVLTACAALLVGGCEEPSEKVIPVTGTATHNGKPVAGLLITFVPQTGKNSYPSYGTTDENGRYTLTNRITNKPGATVGTHKVWVSIPPAPPTEDDKGKGRRTNSSPELAPVLKKYGKLEDTPLTIEVKGSDPTDIKLDLD